jgi:uncharacterized protein (TIGR02246 family)
MKENRMRFRRMAVLAGALALLAGRPATLAAAEATPPVATEAAARHEVEAAMQRYTTLLRTGPVDAQVALFVQDGELLEPGMAPLHGREAIKAFLAPIMAAVDVESATTTSDAIEVFGDAAYQWGTYSQRAGEKGKPAADYFGRYVASWHREADGQWRIARFLVQPFPQGAH